MSFCSDVAYLESKIYQVDIDFSHQELSVRGLEFIVALLVFRGIDFSCASTRGPIQLYVPAHIFQSQHLSAHKFQIPQQQSSLTFLAVLLNKQQKQQST